LLRDLIGDRSFLRRFFQLAVPVTLQYFFAASLNLVDNVMVGQLGAVELAAVGLANRVYFLLLLFLLGVSGGASIFASQLWGQRDVASIRKILGLSVSIAGTAGLLFFGAGAFASVPILRIFSDDPAVVAEGSRFLAISSVSFVMLAITSCYAAVLRSTGEVKLPMMVNVVALVVNTALNYVLIFGLFGMPRLGVAGSAIATVIARAVETAALLWFSYSRRLVVAARLSELTGISADLARRFVLATGTVVTKDMIWAVGVTIYMAIYARMGTDVVASLQIVFTIQQLATVFFNGISSAALVMVGNRIGAGDERSAYAYAKRFLVITLLVGAAIGLLTVLGSGLILAPYRVPAQVTADARSLLFVFAAFLAISTFNTVAVVGVLRAGGDTLFCLIMDLVAVYVIGMPFAVIGALVLKLPVATVFACVTLQEVFKFALCLKRVISRRWINNLVSDFAGRPAAVNE
jgi:putative MATE family efflux protein